VDFEVVKRSGLDVALLKAKAPIARTSFVIDDSGAPPASYRGKRVSMSAYTLTIITLRFQPPKSISVSLLAIPKMGPLSVGSNPSRSGSPVLLDDAKAIAVFRRASRNLRPNWPARHQDRGRVIPIRMVSGLTAPRDNSPWAPLVNHDEFDGSGLRL